MLGGGNDARVSGLMIHIEYSVLLILGGNLLPQGCGALTATVANVEGTDLPDGGVHGNPNPVPVRLLAHQAPGLVQLGLQPL